MPPPRDESCWTGNCTCPRCGLMMENAGERRGRGGDLPNQASTGPGHAGASGGIGSSFQLDHWGRSVRHCPPTWTSFAVFVGDCFATVSNVDSKLAMRYFTSSLSIIPSLYHAGIFGPPTPLPLPESPPWPHISRRRQRSLRLLQQYMATPSAAEYEDSNQAGNYNQVTGL